MFLGKMEIGKSFFKEKHRKLAHGRNLTNKIFPELKIDRLNNILQWQVNV